MGDSSRIVPNTSRTGAASPAARNNRKIMRSLKENLKRDPEANVASLLPRQYANRLLSLQRDVAGWPRTPPPTDGIREMLLVEHGYSVIVELSADVQALLPSGPDHQAEALISLLAGSTVINRTLWETPHVLQISDSVAVKLIHDEESAATESRALRYLQVQSPDFPAPKLHGLVMYGNQFLLFMTCMGPNTLEEVWPRLDETQKQSISEQLDRLLGQLRSLPYPTESPFGEIGTGRCRDTRRGSRVSHQPITDIDQFEDFVFSGTQYTSPTYVQLLRRLKPSSPGSPVLTHGDVRPANIIVEEAQGGEGAGWIIIGIIDWERSGFYPEHWEAVKMTNNLSPSEENDWYLYLPRSVSPSRYAVDWLIDRVLNRNLEHC